MTALDNFLNSGEYLPQKLRDFQDQKNLFKSMHHLYQGSENAKEMPSWVQGHVYTIDWFLWFMASRGYTLQKCRKKDVEFAEWPDFRKILQAENT